MRCHVERIPNLIETLSGAVVTLPPTGQECEGPIHEHHWIPREDGGPDTQENLVPLCKKHHDMVHRIMRIYGRGALVPEQRRLLPH
jgi:5-methylcytosine-specific restriction endonuclease McrA